MWESANEITDFWQWFPVDTLKATQPTVVKFLFDEDNLYLLAISYSESSEIIVPSLRRDFFGRGNDNITLLLDTFMDGTNGFMFGTNPMGVQRESLISNGGNNFQRDYNSSWDVKWKSEASQQDGFWMVEVKIPLRSIQYPDGATQFRANVYRHDTHTTQWSTWTNIPQNQTIASLAFMGILNFERPLKKSKKTIALIPYIGGSVQKDFDENKEKSVFNYGGDAKLSIGSGMFLDLTINPDFSQVEVDDQIINLTRFEVSLPEKRQFFIQNSDLFVNFGDRREAQPFFSRRIGIAKDTLNNTVENKIISGVRLSGKVNNNLRLGFLNMQTQEDNANKIAANNNTVFTLQQKILDRSNLNFIFINRQTTGNPDFGKNKDGEEYTNTQDSFNRVIGTDFNLATKNNRWTGRTFFHYSLSPNQKKDTYATGLNFNYNSKVHGGAFNLVRIGDDYQSDLGFIRRTGILKNFARYTYRIWTESERLRSINLSAGFFYVGKPSKDYLTTDRGTFYNVEFTLTNQGRLNLGYNTRYTYLQDAFNPTGVDNAIVLAADSSYSYNSVEASFGSNPGSVFNFDISSSYGDFYNGTRFSVSSQMNYRAQPYLTASVRINYNRIKLPQPYSSANLLLISPKLDFTFNKNLFWATFIQYTSSSESVGINSRLQWRFSPLSDLFIVYNDNYSVDSEFFPKIRSLTFKLTYWFNN